MVAVVRRECGLLLRKKKIWIAYIAYVALWLWVIVPMEIEPIPLQLRGAFFFNRLNYILFFAMLFFSLIGVYGARSTRLSEFSQLMMTSPISNGELMWGRWMSQAIGVLLWTLFTIMIQFLWYQWGGVPATQLGNDVFYTGMMVGSGVLFSHALGFSLGMMGRGVWIYFLVTSGWLALFWVWSQVENHDIHAYHPMLSLFMPASLYVWVDEIYSGWGISLQLASGLLHQGMIAMLTLLVLGIAWGIFLPKRRIPWERKWNLPVIGILFIPFLCLGFLRYQGIASEWQRYQKEGEFYAHSIEKKKTSEVNWTLETMKLNVSFPRERFLVVKSSSQVVNHSRKKKGELWMTLYHSFKIQAITGKNVASWSRKGDGIHLHFKKPLAEGESTNIHFRYQGNPERIWQQTGRVKTGVVEEEGVFLRKEDGWYPLLGLRDLGDSWVDKHVPWRDFLAPTVMSEEGRTTFDVTVVDPLTPYPFTSNLSKGKGNHFKGSSQYGAMLLAGHFTHMKIMGTNIVVPPEMIPSARKIIARQQPIWQDIKKQLGTSVQPEAILFLPTGYEVDPGNERFTDQGVGVWGVQRLEQLMAEDEGTTIKGWLPVPNHSSDTQFFRAAITWGMSRQLREQHHNRLAHFIEEQGVDGIDGQKKVITYLEEADKHGRRVYQERIRSLYQAYLRQGNDDFTMRKAIQRLEQKERGGHKG